MADDDGQQIVEVVSHTGGELADGLHFLGLAQLGFQTPLVGRIKPRGEEEFWSSMEAWYLAVSGDRDGFLNKLTTVLEQTNSLDTIVWIDQDEDLDPFRSDARFIELLRIHRQRLGAIPPTPAPTPAPAATPAPPVAAPVP